MTDRVDLRMFSASNIREKPIDFVVFSTAGPATDAARLSGCSEAVAVAHTKTLQYASLSLLPSIFHYISNYCQFVPKPLVGTVR